MERAAKLVRKLQGSGGAATAEIAAAAWTAAVGKRLSLRTGKVSLYGKRLVVEVEDATWQGQLSTLAPQILHRIHTIAGSDLVTYIEFRIGAVRRMPGAAVAATPDADRADGVTDPIFRLLYLASRAEAERLDSARERIIA